MISDLQKEKIAIKLGKRIKEFREYLGFSQREFGRVIGKSVVTVNHWENGRNRLRIEDLYELVDLDKEKKFFGEVWIRDFFNGDMRVKWWNGIRRNL